jgi:RimJ/RimL family protein N-acetyltransferase
MPDARAPYGQAVEAFQTARLTLREVLAPDLDDVAAMLATHRVMRLYPRPYSREEAAQSISCCRDSYYRDNGWGLRTALVTATGPFVGHCGITLTGRSSRASSG